MRTSFFQHVVRQFICIRRCSRKMRSERFANFLNCFNQRVAEFLILKMHSHSVHHALPELVAAFLVNRFVADYGKLVRTSEPLGALSRQ